MFPYNYYTKTRYIKRIGNIEEALKSMDGTKEELSEASSARGAFIESIKNGNSYIDDKTFDM